MRVGLHDRSGGLFRRLLEPVREVTSVTGSCPVLGVFSRIRYFSREVDQILLVDDSGLMNGGTMKKFILFGLVVLLAGCQETSKKTTNIQPSTSVAGLRSFENCEELTQFLDTRIGSEPTPMSVEASGAAADGAEGSPAEPVSTATVEEADIVKVEGNRLYVANLQAGLLIYDVTNPHMPQRIGQVHLDLYPQEIYVHGTQVVVIGDPISAPVSPDQPVASIWLWPTTRVDVFNLSDPSSPEKLQEYDLQGTYADSRKVGPSVYLALQGTLEGGGIQDELYLKDPCDTVYVPEDLDGGGYFSFLSWDLVGIDLNLLPEEPSQVTVVGSWDSVVYATPTHFYLTNYFYEGQETGIYLFDLDPSHAGVAARANAFVPGSIVNQFSMDEKDGVFRIASTVAVLPVLLGDPVLEGDATTVASIEPSPSPPPPPPPETTNYLTTFRVSDGSLNQLGQIDSIVPGESITAVRFLGDRAFVTTFVYIDPLVAIDLSDPSAPEVKGELHVPGRTSHLLAWGEDRLIALGTSGGFWGNVILNLFDVSDLDHPTLVEQETIPSGYYSEALFEHLAFSFFEDRRVVAFPVESDLGSRIVLYSVDRDGGFTSLGSIDHNDLVNSGNYVPPMRRSLEIGEVLYTVSEAGLKANEYEDLINELFGEMFSGFKPPGF